MKLNTDEMSAIKRRYSIDQKKRAFPRLTPDQKANLRAYVAARQKPTGRKRPHRSRAKLMEHELYIARLRRRAMETIIEQAIREEMAR